MDDSRRRSIFNIENWKDKPSQGKFVLIATVLKDILKTKFCLEWCGVLNERKQKQNL